MARQVAPPCHLPVRFGIDADAPGGLPGVWVQPLMRVAAITVRARGVSLAFGENIGGVARGASEGAI